MVTLNVTSGQYISFAHKLLWDSSQRHLTIASERPNDSWALTLSAGLLATAAFEAYLNYLGEEILPSVWADERKYFSTEPYVGTLGKLKRIAEELNWPLPPKSSKPFTDVAELQSLRHKMVHAKPKRESYTHVHQEGRLPRAPLSWLTLEAPEEKIRALIDAVESLAVELHKTILKSEFQHVIFGTHPFLGALGFGSGTTQKA